MSITSVDGDPTHTGWQSMRERLAFVWLEVREAAQILRLYSLVWFQGTPVVRRIKTTRDNVKCSRYTSDLLLNSQPEDVLCLIHTNKQDMCLNTTAVLYSSQNRPVGHGKATAVLVQVFPAPYLHEK